MSAAIRQLRPLQMGESPTLQQYLDVFDQAPTLSFEELFCLRPERQVRSRLAEKSVDLTSMPPEAREYILHLTRNEVHANARALAVMLKDGLAVVGRKGRPSKSVVSDAIISFQYQRVRNGNPTWSCRQLERRVATDLQIKIGRSMLATNRVRHANARHVRRIEALIEYERFPLTILDVAASHLYNVLIFRLCELRGQTSGKEPVAQYVEKCAAEFKAYWAFAEIAIRLAQDARRYSV
jgi:hypothetical protein